MEEQAKKRQSSWQQMWRDQQPQKVQMLSKCGKRELTEHSHTDHCTLPQYSCGSKCLHVAEEDSGNCHLPGQVKPPGPKPGFHFIHKSTEGPVQWLAELSVTSRHCPSCSLKGRQDKGLGSLVWSTTLIKQNNNKNNNTSLHPRCHSCCRLWGTNSTHWFFHHSEWQGPKVRFLGWTRGVCGAVLESAPCEPVPSASLAAWAASLIPEPLAPWPRPSGQQAFGCSGHLAFFCLRSPTASFLKGLCTCI